MKFKFGIAGRILFLILVGSFASAVQARQAAPAKPSAQPKPATKAVAAKPPVASEPVIPIQIIPQPSSVTPGKGQFVITAHTQIVAPAMQQALAEQLRDYLRPATGFTLPIMRAGTASSISLVIDHSLKRLGPEGY